MCPSRSPYSDLKPRRAFDTARGRYYLRLQSTGLEELALISVGGCFEDSDLTPFVFAVRRACLGLFDILVFCTASEYSGSRVDSVYRPG
jgi:hypothetical protein